MKRLASLLCTALLAACSAGGSDPGKTEITLMRFFGSCEAQYGQVRKAARASASAASSRPWSTSSTRRTQTASS